MTTDSQIREFFGFDQTTDLDAPRAGFEFMSYREVAQAHFDKWGEFQAAETKPGADGGCTTPVTRGDGPSVASGFTDHRIVLCEACNGESRLYHGDPDSGWSEPCASCEGTGGEIIETQPIEMSDLDITPDTDPFAHLAELQRREFCRRWHEDNGQRDWDAWLP